jgi:hypothetical protein
LLAFDGEVKYMHHDDLLPVTKVDGGMGALAGDGSILDSIYR